MTKKLILLAIMSVFTLTSCDFINGFKGNTTKEGVIYIPRGADFNQVLDSIKPYLKNVEEFKKFAESADYPATIKPGKYKILADDSSSSIIDRLQGGEQEEVKLRIKNEPTLYHMIGSVSRQVDIDSTELANYIAEWSIEKDTALNAETVKQFFIPETYFVYWSITPEKFVERMEKQYNIVWNEERLAKAKAMDMTPLEVTTLASIVQLESSDHEEDQKAVAKAYLNRLAIDMRLEADPTSIYAHKLENGFDQKVQRVYKKLTWSHNAYNTYRNKGLPPAPICLPNVPMIDAVLNPADHDYIYFAADPDRPGYHSFAKTFEEHKVNADKYRKWVKENNIK
ncbi:MAG: endolytic transglycosylase MltG [Weeksellaceae bacterium]|nr:endolytic transglycosylase MltG [Weeksellaceae bacterium]